jgi:hypothetical protein
MPVRAAAGYRPQAAIRDQPIAHVYIEIVFLYKNISTQKLLPVQRVAAAVCCVRSGSATFSPVANVNPPCYQETGVRKLLHVEMPHSSHAEFLT